MEAHQEELGPVDIVAIGFPPGAPMTGEAVPILLDLIERRIIRVLDALFVMHTDDGVAGFEAKDLDETGIGDFKEFDGASTGLLGDEDVASVGEVLEPGSAAVLIVYENRWAAPFVSAVRRNGGELLASERIPVPDLLAALDAAEANA
jgi:hypothetical protein